MTAQKSATTNHVDRVEIVDDDDQMRHTRERKPHPFLASSQRNAGVHADLFETLKVDFRRFVAETGFQDADIGLDGELGVADDSELPGQARRAQCRVAAEVCPGPVCVDVNELDGRDARGLDEDNAVCSYPSATATDS